VIVIFPNIPTGENLKFKYICLNPSKPPINYLGTQVHFLMMRLLGINLSVFHFLFWKATYLVSQIYGFIKKTQFYQTTQTLTWDMIQTLTNLTKGKSETGRLHSYNYNVVWFPSYFLVKIHSCKKATQKVSAKFLCLHEVSGKHRHVILINKPINYVYDQGTS